MHSISSSTSTNQPIHFLNSQLTFQSKIQYIDQNLTTVREIDRSTRMDSDLTNTFSPSQNSFFNHLTVPPFSSSPSPFFLVMAWLLKRWPEDRERERETSDQHVRRHKSLLDLYCIRNGRSTPVLINGWSNGESSSEGTLKGSSSKELHKSNTFTQLYITIWPALNLFHPSRTHRLESDKQIDKRSSSKPFLILLLYTSHIFK